MKINLTKCMHIININLVKDFLCKSSAQKEYNIVIY